MPTWGEVEAAVPELAAVVRARFEAHGLGYLATLRADGSPRISGAESLFHAGDLWFGMMPGSRKSLDLRRDPRFGYHAASIDPQVADGDARISGVAVAVHDDATREAYLGALLERTGHGAPPGPFDLWRADVRELTFIRPEGAQLVVRWWTPAGGEQRVARS